MKKAWPWLIGFIGAILYFAYFETEAFIHPDQYDTLSHVVATVGAKWPVAIWICGAFAGGLACHFWWAWRDNPMGKGGG